MGESRQPIRFGIFEADLMSHTLRKRGVRVRLQELPFRLLVMLADRAGKVVTREELKQELWAEADYGEFDLGINTAVSKLRQALNDSASTPRFIETIPKVGYRFVAPIAEDAADGSAQEQKDPKISRRVLIGAAAAVPIGAALLRFSEVPPERSVRRWKLSPPGWGAAVVSPNGRHIAYTVGARNRAIWVQDLDRFEPRKLEGTEGALSFFCFWSPDSRWIGFTVDEEIRKVPVEGGPATTISSLPIAHRPAGFKGASWSPNGESVAFVVGGPAAPDLVFTVPAQGGEPKPLFDSSKLTQSKRINFPVYLPGEAAANLLLVANGSSGPREVVLQNLETGESLPLPEGDQPVYSNSGHIIYHIEGDLWALPFSLSRLEATGEPFPIAQDGAFPSVSDEGTLVYVGSTEPGLHQLVWLDRSGGVVGTIGQPQHGMLFAALSPDDGRVAVISTENGAEDIFIHEVGRPVRRRLTFDDTHDYRPQWSPNNEIVYQSFRDVVPGLFRIAVDGGGEPKLMVDDTHGYPRPYNWSRDGKYFIYTVSAKERWAVRYLKRGEDGEESESSESFSTRFGLEEAALSPDGRFVAYCSNQSGKFEVYVREFPSGTGEALVSTNGGREPRWSHDGAELFFLEPGQPPTLMAVQVVTSPRFSAGNPVPLFSRPAFWCGYGVARDGRFVAVELLRAGDRGSIQVTHNWYEEFREREN